MFPQQLMLEVAERPRMGTLEEPENEHDGYVCRYAHCYSYSTSGHSCTYVCTGFYTPLPCKSIVLNCTCSLRDSAEHKCIAYLCV